MKIVLTYGDDWQGLYINDVLITEGHSVTVAEAVEAISERLPRLDISFETKEANYAWLNDRGGFPDKLEKVKLSNV